MRWYVRCLLPWVVVPLMAGAAAAQAVDLSPSATTTSSTTPGPTHSSRPVGSYTPYRLVSYVRCDLHVHGLTRTDLLQRAADMGLIFRGLAWELGWELAGQVLAPTIAEIMAVSTPSQGVTEYMSSDHPLNVDSFRSAALPTSGRRLRPMVQVHEGKRAAGGQQDEARDRRAALAVDARTQADPEAVGARQLQVAWNASDVILLLSIQFEMLPNDQGRRAGQVVAHRRRCGCTAVPTQSILGMLSRTPPCLQRRRGTLLRANGS
jgi:hypothetical protein